jgi:catechol 2,3-dioxygenase-like lactoylglutathione lyase family enzyme
MVLLLTNDEQSIGSRSTVMDHIGFKVRDIETFLDKWRSAGFEVGREFIGAEGQKNAYITMPDEIYVELQEDQALPEAVTAYHLHFYTSEYRSLLNWYLSVFDLSIRPRGSISTTTNVPGMNLSFADSSTTRLATTGSAIDSIGFEVKNLDRTLQTLRDKQISITPPSKFLTSLGIKSAALTDPSGVTIILTEGLMNFP